MIARIIAPIKLPIIVPMIHGVHLPQHRRAAEHLDTKKTIKINQIVTLFFRI